MLSLDLDVPRQTIDDDSLVRQLQRLSQIPPQRVNIARYLPDPRQLLRAARLDHAVDGELVARGSDDVVGQRLEVWRRVRHRHEIGLARGLRIR